MHLQHLIALAHAYASSYIAQVNMVMMLLKYRNVAFPFNVS
jgi:hypothetical protein